MMRWLTTYVPGFWSWKGVRDTVWTDMMMRVSCLSDKESAVRN